MSPSMISSPPQQQNRMLLSSTNAIIPRWLSRLDLPQAVKQILHREKVDEADFYELTDDDLKSIGLELGYRKKVLRLIEYMLK